MDTFDSARSRAAWPLGFAALGLVLGSLFVYPRQLTRGFLINDEAWYAEPARNLAEGRGFVTETLYPMFANEVDALPMEEPFKQIGYPLVGAVISSVTGLSDQLFVVLALIGFGLTGMTTWLVTSALTKNRTAAAVITLATVGNPVLWGWWTAALPELMFAALFLGALWLLLQPSIRARFGAGGLLAASVYFKGFAVLYLPLAGAFVLLGAGRQRLRHTGSFAAGVVATVLAATVLLPSGTSQLSGAGTDYAGSMLLYETRGAYPQHEGPLYDTTPLRPLAYVFTHPLDYGEKVARMMSRTTVIVGELGGPAFGGILFPLLLLIGLSVGVEVLGWRRRAGGSGGNTESRARYDDVMAVRVLLAGLIVINFAFFWAGNFKARYFAHLFPLMLAGAFLEWNRLVPGGVRLRRGAAKVLAVAAVGYFLVYPPEVGLWHAYRNPYAYLGRGLVVRWVDYDQVAKDVVAHVPERGMVMSDMAHEISWYADRPTVFFPSSEDQFEYLLDRFDVRALYEHPQGRRDWAMFNERFELIDDRNGKFWVRRDQLPSHMATER